MALVDQKYCGPAEMTFVESEEKTEGPWWVQVE